MPILAGDINRPGASAREQPPRSSSTARVAVMISPTPPSTRAHRTGSAPSCSSPTARDRGPARPGSRGPDTARLPARRCLRRPLRRGGGPDQVGAVRGEVRRGHRGAHLLVDVGPPGPGGRRPRNIQQSYRLARLSASMPVLNVVDGLVALAFGLVAFSEVPRHEPLFVVVEVLAFAAIAGGWSSWPNSRSAATEAVDAARTVAAVLGGCGQGDSRTWRCAFSSGLYRRAVRLSGVDSFGVAPYAFRSQKPESTSRAVYGDGVRDRLQWAASRSSARRPGARGGGWTERSGGGAAVALLRRVAGSRDTLALAVRGVVGASPDPILAPGEKCRIGCPAGWGVEGPALD